MSNNYQGADNTRMFACQFKFKFTPEEVLNNLPLVSHCESFPALIPTGVGDR